MGLNPAEARSTIRFSLDYDTSREDIAHLMSHLPRLISDLRAAASPRTVARMAGTRSELAAQPA
jgi:cysteine sulfinate desulfinase/cysteine desulfurase-like protein